MIFINITTRKYRADQINEAMLSEIDGPATSKIGGARRAQ